MIKTNGYLLSQKKICSSLGQDSNEPAHEKKFLLFDVLMSLRDFTIREISAIKTSKLGKVLRNFFL